MNSLGHWTFNGGILNPSDFIGFIYCITNKTTGKKYIGQKQFHFKTTKKPLKGNRNKRHSLRSSDWTEYTGSSAALQKDIDQYGKDNFTFDILYPCRTKNELNYQEAKEIIMHDAIWDDSFYNCGIRLRVTNREKL